VDATRLPVQVASALSTRARGLRETLSAPKATGLGLGNARRQGVGVAAPPAQPRPVELVSRGVEANHVYETVTVSLW
jgi:hypothetical protein